MLILAGVSINAIVGDNGVITNAHQATIKQSCAALSEYLNEMYVEDFANEIGVDENNAKSKLEKFLEKHPNIFFFNETYDYVLVDSVDSEENPIFLKLRLIRKVNLVNNIKEQLIGGDANNDDHEAYLALQDVYGVTDDLQVYYCKDGVESIVGADFKNSSSLDGSLVIYPNGSSVSRVLAETLRNTTTKDATLAEIRGMRQLTISGSSGVMNLNFLFDMPNVTKLTFKDYAGSLEGIGNLKNLTYIYFDNTNETTNINYKDLRYATGLTELYFYMPTNSEISKMCTEMGKSTYSNLETLALFGYDENGGNDYVSGMGWEKKIQVNSKLDSVEYLGLLNEDTKSKVKVLFLNHNSLKSLSGIEGFIGVQKLYLSENPIETKTIEIENDNGESTYKIVYGMSDYLGGMTALSTLFCKYCGITTDDLNNINNSTIKYFSIQGNSVSSINVIKKFTKLLQFNALKISGLTLDDELVDIITSCTVYYMDSEYSTKLSLANIGEKMELGVDATNSSLEKLRDSTLVKYLSIKNNKTITDDKLQEILPTLTELIVLDACGSNLTTLNFIQEDSKLKVLDIWNTTISDLSKLSNCSNLQSLLINTTGIDLKPYSNLISDMCDRDKSGKIKFSSYDIIYGGLIAPLTILQTLNGTESEPNLDFTVFSCYSGGVVGKKELDLSYTGLEKLRRLWDSFTIKVPSSYCNFDSSECAGVTIDYSNVIDGEYYRASQVNSSNYTNFKGYETVISESNSLNIIGTNTRFLKIGSREPRIPTSFSSRTDYSRLYDISSFVEKAPNLEKLVLYKIGGISDISMLMPLKLQILQVGSCSVEDLNLSRSTEEINLYSNLESLTITYSELKKIEGLDNLTSLVSLNLSNNYLENYVTVKDYTKQDGTKTLKTAKYIAESVPSTCSTINLSGNADLTDFEDLLNAGFTQTSPGVFNR